MRVSLLLSAVSLLVSWPLFAADIEYPVTAKVDQRDTYHGTEVADPYRWLEQDVRNSDEVAAWVEQQNALTFGYLDGLPQRDAIQSRLTELWNYERFGVPIKRGDWFYYAHNNGLQNQSVVYRTKTLGEAAEVVLDPNNWSEDGTVALGGYAISDSGRYVAYSLQDGGTDWRIWRVRDTETGKDLEDELRWVKFSGVAWRQDEQGFYYSRYPEPKVGEEFQSLNKNMSVYYHKIGTPQFADTPVHARPDQPDWGFGTEVTSDGRWLVVTTWVGTDDRYRLEYLDLTAETADVKVIEDAFRAGFELIDGVGSELFFRTTLDAPMGRIVKIDLGSAEPTWQEVVSESDQVLQSVSRVGDALVLQYLEDAHSRVVAYNLAGEKQHEVALPGIGSASGFPGASTGSETHFSYSSLNRPSTIYRYDVNTGKSEAVMKPQVAFNPDDFVVKQVFYPSADGTKIPMFIAHKRGVELDGAHPTLLYGYGGFNISLRPGFSVTRLAWMDMGGIFAMANLRGGGEYGEAWHKAGTKLQKQNVFDDFIAAAEYLIDAGYTNASKLAIQGGSNGGLLVGATINQRPDLFAAALPAVGVMDMLRFHQFTAGRFWTDDYGSADNPEEFAALYAYSPYHNIRDGVAYPATLVTTADTDDRVVPGHSFKYIARLQEAHEGDAPVMIRIQTRAGHGAGKPTSMRIREYADLWAWLAHHLDMEI